MSSIVTNSSRFTAPAHALLRIMTSLTYISHGTMKFFGFPMMPPIPGQPAMGPPPLLSLMGFAGILEIAGGLLLLVGFMTRPTAFLLAGQMAVAFWLAHAPQGLVPLSNGGEAAYLFCFIFLWLAAAGPGPASLDALLGKDAN